MRQESVAYADLADLEVDSRQSHLLATGKRWFMKYKRSKEQ